VCDIKPEESIFIDDNTRNIEASRSFGFNGYVFDGSANNLKSYLDGVLGK
jgi:FMN phosphatase YigB (HAD superfamily)